MLPSSCADGVGHFRPAPLSFPLCCPRNHCEQAKCAAKNTLVKGTSWCQLKCSHCKRTSSAAKWLCSCHIPWHQCTEHRPQGFACGSKAIYKKSKCTRTSVSHSAGLGETPSSLASMPRIKKMKLGEGISEISTKTRSASSKLPLDNASKSASTAARADAVVSCGATLCASPPPCHAIAPPKGNAAPLLGNQACQNTWR